MLSLVNTDLTETTHPAERDIQLMSSTDIHSLVFLLRDLLHMDTLTNPIDRPCPLPFIGVSLHCIVHRISALVL